MEQLATSSHRHASLTEQQDHKVLTWTEGRYTRSDMVAAFRKLDKVVTARTKSTYFEDRGEEGDSFHEEVEEESDGERIYVAEGDLNKISEEPEVAEALASYREVRQALKDQKKGRVFFPAKAPSAKAASTKTRVHVEQLKLRTRCGNCVRIGHWSNERREPRKKEGSQAGSSQAGTSSGSAAKTGFFAFWLREFVQGRRDRLEFQEMSANAEEAYKERGGRDGEWEQV